MTTSHECFHCDIRAPRYQDVSRENPISHCTENLDLNPNHRAVCTVGIPVSMSDNLPLLSKLSSAPTTIPTASTSFSVCENFQRGAVYSADLHQAQEQWCSGHFLYHQMGSRHSDIISVQQQVQKPTVALHTGESLHKRAVKVAPTWFK